MTLSVKNRVLLAVAAVLLALNLVGGGAGSAREDLPSLPAVAPRDVTRIRISNPVESLTLIRTATGKDEQDPDTWRIAEPLDFPADASQVRTLLRAFGPGVEMEARIDEGNLEDYGLDDQSGRLVELYTVGDTPTLSVWVGKTASGTSTFVRLPGSRTVYRADLGGMQRFYRAAAEWRDKWVIEVDRNAVRALVVRRGSETLRFRRLSAPLDGSTDDPGTWTLDDVPFEADSAAIGEVVKAVTRLRAGDIHNPDYPGGFEAPAAVAELELEDGTRRQLTLGSAAEGSSAFVKVDGRDEVFRVAASVRRLLLQPVDAFRSRQVLSFLRAEVATVTLVDGGLTVVLRALDGGERWEVAQPPNMDVDQRQARFTVNTLATLRAAGVPSDRSFAPTGTRFIVGLRDGRTLTLEVGATERDPEDRPVVRVRSDDGVWWIPASQLSQLKRAFGRG